MRAVRALALWAAIAAPSAAGAQRTAEYAARTGPTLRVEVRDPLPAHAPATVDVYVRLPEGSEQPLLLTPSAEGDAVRVVRGRMLRADARRTERGELHFQVPIEALGEGTAVLRFTVFTYRCAARCEPVRRSESRTVQVRR